MPVITSTPARLRGRDYRGQPQFGPQLQVSPQRHPARRLLDGAWQPQVHVAPAHEAHEHVVAVGVLFDITSSFESG